MTGTRVSAGWGQKRWWGIYAKYHWLVRIKACFLTALLFLSYRARRAVFNLSIRVRDPGESSLRRMLASPHIILSVESSITLNLVTFLGIFIKKQKENNKNNTETEWFRWILYEVIMISHDLVNWMSYGMFYFPALYGILSFDYSCISSAYNNFGELGVSDNFSKKYKLKARKFTRPLGKLKFTLQRRSKSGP